MKGEKWMIVWRKPTGERVCSDQSWGSKLIAWRNAKLAAPGLGRLYLQGRKSMPFEIQPDTPANRAGQYKKNEGVNHANRT